MANLGMSFPDYPTGTSLLYRLYSDIKTTGFALFSRLDGSWSRFSGETYRATQRIGPQLPDIEALLDFIKQTSSDSSTLEFYSYFPLIEDGDGWRALMLKRNPDLSFRFHQIGPDGRAVVGLTKLVGIQERPKWIEKVEAGYLIIDQEGEINLVKGLFGEPKP